jgi:gluconate 2-dehydrogenase gamma chain
MNRAVSRRLVIKIGAAASALWTGLSSRAFAETIRRRLPWSAQVSDRPAEIDQRPGYLFFNVSEGAFVEAAVARLIPSDETGPGAIEADVPRFIDRQLAGPYGACDHFYLQIPFSKGLATQGWQAPSPAEVYRAAIVEIDRWSTSTYGKPFASLNAATQDDALKTLESGKAQLSEGIDAKAFFALLLQNTLEGYFADPIYGGNRDMAAWRMIGFPGARYDLRPFVSRFGEPYTLPPVSLSGRRA